MRPISRLFATVTLAAVTTAAHADVIRLKASIRAPRDGSMLRLRDVAVLEGAEAEQYADLVVAEITNPDKPTEIPIRHVRQRLDEAGVHWGRLHLNGTEIVVRPRRKYDAAPPAAMKPAALVAASGSRSRPTTVIDEAGAASIVAAHTIRGGIARMMIAELRLDPNDLRLRFEPADRDLLDRPMGGGGYQLEPASNAGSTRVVFTVRVWANGTIAETRRVVVRPLVRASTAVLRHRIARHDILATADFAVEEAWLPPSEARQTCAAEAIVGHEAVRALEVGSVVRPNDLRSPTVIDRGDRVNVRCLVGGVVISLQAEARSDAGIGERIELRKLRERATFMATVTGPGEAVVDLSRK